jgi:hypothetical protein
VKCFFGQVKTAPNLSDRASENDSVICSIPEEQNNLSFSLAGKNKYDVDAAPLPN